MRHARGVVSRLLDICLFFRCPAMRQDFVCGRGSRGCTRLHTRRINSLVNDSHSAKLPKVILQCTWWERGEALPLPAPGVCERVVNENEVTLYPILTTTIVLNLSGKLYQVHFFGYCDAQFAYHTPMCGRASYFTSLSSVLYVISSNWRNPHTLLDFGVQHHLRYRGRWKILVGWLGL